MIKNQILLNNDARNVSKHQKLFASRGRSFTTVWLAHVENQSEE